MSTTSKDCCDALQARVQALENKIKVATAVAVIFGISGAFGANMLNSAKTKIDDLEKQIGTLQSQVSDVQSARDNAIAAIRAEENTQVSTFKGQVQPLAADAVNSQLQGQIAAVKHWTAFIYSEAARIGPTKEGANGWWQVSLSQQSATVQAQLR